jgi:hypothetical protein
MNRYIQHQWQYGHHAEYVEYYLAQAKWIVGGNVWSRYYQTASTSFLSLQESDGHWEGPDGDVYGSTYATAIALIIPAAAVRPPPGLPAVIRDLRGEARRSAEGQFVHPRYGGYSFADIPGSIASLLGVDSGARCSMAQSSSQFAAAASITSFSSSSTDSGSTTGSSAPRGALACAFRRARLAHLADGRIPIDDAAALTTLSTGLPPLQHGLPEWMIYVEELDEIIFTLPFRRWNSRQRDELAALGHDGRLLFEGRTIFDTLAAAGIPSVAFCHSAYAQSAYSLASKRGSRSVGFLGAADLAVRIADELEAATTPTFFYVYWDHLDTLEHAHAPRSREARVEISLMSRLLPTQLPDCSARPGGELPGGHCSS